MHAAVAYGRGQHAVHIINVYGPAGDRSTLSHPRAVDAFLSDVFAAAEGLGGVPTLIAGDFNIDMARSAVLSAVTASGRWIDLAALGASLCGDRPLPTCFTSSSHGGSRIDFIFANSVAAAAFRSLRVIPDSGIPTHRPIEISLNLPVFTSQVLRVTRPLAFPVPDWLPWSSSDEDTLATTLWADSVTAWNTALDNADVNQLWAIFGDVAERYFIQRSGPKLPSGTHRYRGRGSDKPPRLCRLTAWEGHDRNGSVSSKDFTLFTLLNRLEEYERWRRAYPASIAPYPICRLLTKIQSDMGGLMDCPLTWRQTFDPGLAPSLEATAAVVTAVRARTAAVHRADRDARTQRHRSWVQTATQTGKIFQALRGDQLPPATMLKRSDGTFTADLPEIDGLLRTAWDKIFRLYASTPEPEWTPFFQRYKPHIQAFPMTMTDLTADDLATTLARQSAHSAAGMDGWRVAELKRLPRHLLSQLAYLFNVIERSGRWPSSLERAVITLIPKGDGGGDPLAMRPISVTSAVYRLWAATRLRTVLEWQERWIHPSQHGFRPNHGTIDVYWELAARVEDALLSGDRLYGILLDYAKCFDRLPHSIMLNLAKAMGAPPRLLSPLSRMYHSLRRRFKFNGSVGAEFHATNGIFQGCPLSVVLLNLLVCIWANVITTETPAIPMAYADDATTIGARAAVEQAGSLTTEFCNLTGQLLNVKKCVGFAVNAPPNDPPLSLQGVPLKMVTADRILGADVRFRPDAAPSAHVDSRVHAARTIINKISVLPLPLTAKS